MISLSTIEATGYDTVVIYESPNSVLTDGGARISRMATLDGGVVIDHFGFVHGDRTFDIEARVDEAQAAIITQMRNNESLMHLSCAEGFFSCVVASCRIDNGDLILSVFIKEKLD